MLTQEPSTDWLNEHQRISERMRVLRQVYSRWFGLLRRACVPGLSVELGCGSAFLKRRHPPALTASRCLLVIERGADQHR